MFPSPVDQAAEKQMTGLPVEFQRQNECAAQEPAAALFPGSDRQGNIKSRLAEGKPLAPCPKSFGDPEHVFECRPAAIGVKYFKIELIF
jgi:hypothetical protein